MKKLESEEFLWMEERHRTWLTTRGREGAQADFSGMDLRAIPRKRNGDYHLPRAIFREVLADGAVWVASTRLNQADFTGASFKEAQFSHATVYGADFSGATLLGADFTGAGESLRTAKTPKPVLVPGQLWKPPWTAPEAPYMGLYLGDSACGEYLRLLTANGKVTEEWASWRKWTDPGLEAP